MVTVDSLWSVLAQTGNWKRMHMITFACLENEFHFRVLNFL